METRRKTRAGQTQVSPEGVLTEPEPRPPIDMDEDLGLATLLGDGEVPIVGGDRPEVRATTSVPGGTSEASEWVPAREPVVKICAATAATTVCSRPEADSASVSVPKLASASDAFSIST